MVIKMCYEDFEKHMEDLNKIGKMIKKRKSYEELIAFIEKLEAHYNLDDYDFNFLNEVISK